MESLIKPDSKHNFIYRSLQKSKTKFQCSSWKNPEKCLVDKRWQKGNGNMDWYFFYFTYKVTFTLHIRFRNIRTQSYPSTVCVKWHLDCLSLVPYLYWPSQVETKIFTRIFLNMRLTMVLSILFSAQAPTFSSSRFSTHRESQLLPRFGERPH